MRTGLMRGVRRVVKRAGRTVFGPVVMGVWVLLPALPVLGVLCSWLVGIR